MTRTAYAAIHLIIGEDIYDPGAEVELAYDTAAQRKVAQQFVRQGVLSWDRPKADPAAAAAARRRQGAARKGQA